MVPSVPTANPAWGTCTSRVFLLSGTSGPSTHLTHSGFIFVCHRFPLTCKLQDLYRRKQNQQEGKLALQSIPPSALPGKSGVQEPLPWQFLFMWQAVCFRQKLGDNGFSLMAVTVLRGQPKHQPQGNGRLKILERARQLVPRSVLVSLAWRRVQHANCAPECCGSAGVRECP